VGCATTSEGGNLGPGGDRRKTRFSENFGSLTNENFFGFVDLRRKTLDTVNEGRKVDLIGFGAKRMKQGLGFEMVVLKRVDGDLECAFESRTVGTNMEINGFNSRHDYLV